MATLFIGVGNPDRGDDAVGPFVAALLAAAGLEVRLCRGETTELMDAWEGRDNVVVIDAMRSGAEAGTTSRFDAHAGTFPTAAFTGSTHSFGLAEAIELARALGSLPDALVVWGVEGARFDAGEPLSAPVEQAGRRLAERLSG